VRIHWEVINVSASDSRADAAADRPPSQADPPRRVATHEDRFWIHQSSFLFRRDKPEKMIETVWIAHPGWGYVRRRDLWVPVECSEQDLRARGFIERKPPSDGEVSFCPHCGMYVNGVPAFLVHKHSVVCGGPGEEWLKMEEVMISERRVSYYQKLIADRLAAETAEQEAQERKDRFDRIREENLARQHQKDRKKRLKETTKREWKQR
jgi:hypothetical protein